MYIPLVTHLSRYITGESTCKCIMSLFSYQKTIASCPGSEVKEIHHFRLLGKELVSIWLVLYGVCYLTFLQYDRYQQFGSEDCLLQMGGILCPQLNCGMGLLPETPDRRVQCPAQIGGCGVSY